MSDTLDSHPTNDASRGTPGAVTENTVTPSATAGPGAADVSSPAGASGEQTTHEMVRDALGEVYDPEIGIDIVSLGLVYGSHVSAEGLLTVDLTLTSPYCPMGPLIQTQVHAMVKDLPGVTDVLVNLVWSPPWDPRTMASEEARLELGIY
jgi:metal-sulfur cluster biosynthetic enzyme